jgi:hypothetical protein
MLLLFMGGSPPVKGEPALFSQLVSGRAPARVQQQVLSRGRQAFQRIVRRPEQVSNQDRQAIALLSPTQRAELLKDLPGFKLKRVSFAATGGTGRVDKMRLTVKPGSRQLRILSQVMGPNTLGLLPAKNHSYSVWYDQVVDLYFSDMQPLRPGSKPIFPIWLSSSEAKRMDRLYRLGIGNGFSQVFGKAKMYGRPAVWPPASLSQRSTANSCTSCFHRMPLGERNAAYSWIDSLERAVAHAPLARRITDGKGLLASLNGKSDAQISSTFTTLKRALPGQDSRLDELKSWVQLYRRQIPGFPLELMHRKSVGQLAALAGDHPGPGNTRKAIRGSTSPRVGLEIKFQSAP